MRLLPAVEKPVRELRSAGKPMGFTCIAPVVAGLVLGGERVELARGSPTSPPASTS